MKFSIIIPTQDRPELVYLAAYYALNQNYKDIELIVSDNSTTADHKKRNQLKLEGYVKSNKLLLVGPEKELSAPEHFEFALQYATGDYVFFLTDKMMLLPNTLTIAADAINKSGAEIVNWNYYPFITDNYLEPSGSGSLYYIQKSLDRGYKKYDPLKALANKASGFILRSDLSAEEYIKGKICFGGFSKELISRIVSKSGSLFGGATHDYSALVQALCLKPTCISLKERGILFISLPVDKSWGSLTHIEAAGALRYYQAFKDPKLILNSLLVPGLYSSSHNMVAHDYIKYLKIYGKLHLFIKKFWISAIANDLSLPEKKWSSEEERNSQYNLLMEYIKNNPDAETLPCRGRFHLIFKSALVSKSRKFLVRVVNKLARLSFLRRIKCVRDFLECDYKRMEAASLEAAFKFLNTF